MHNSGKRSSIILLARKEWYRFFTDRRMVITSLVFPGVLLYVVYSFLVPAMSRVVMGNGRVPVVYTITTPPSMLGILTSAEFTVQEISEEGQDTVLEKIADKSGDFLLVFPIHFEEMIAVYDIRSGSKAPDVRLYYNSLADGFTVNYTKLIAVLNLYESALSNKFDVNRESGGDLSDLSKGDNSSNRIFAMMFPMLILMFMFQGALVLTVESITGEKERGTLATILVTPISVWELSAGKILGLGAESLLCGLSGTFGALLAMPRFFDSVNAGIAAKQGANFVDVSSLSLPLYSVGDYVLLFLVVLSTTYLIVTLIALVSIRAKTTKEAQMLLTPMLIIIILACLLSAFYGSELRQKIYFFLIPLYNSAQSMTCIFSHEYVMVDIIVTITANVIFSMINVFFLSLLFKNEKILFTR